MAGIGAGVNRQDIVNALKGKRKAGINPPRHPGRDQSYAPYRGPNSAGRPGFQSGTPDPPRRNVPVSTQNIGNLVKGRSRYRPTGRQFKRSPA